VADSSSREPATASHRNLDLVRAIAVLIVVARHVVLYYDVPERPWFQHWPFGTAGVAIFFVHTSLVLMFSLDRQSVGGQPVHGPFLVRRIFRIYPLSVIAVVATVFVFHVADPGIIDARVVWANLGLVQNLVGVQSVLVVLWSLPLEMQMYLVLPFLFRLVKIRGWPVIAFVMLPSSILLASLEHLWKWLPTLVPYVPCFVAGVLSFAIWDRLRPRLPWPVIPATIAAGVLAYMLAYHRLHWHAVLAVPMCLALGLLLPLCREIPAGRLSRAAKVVATYSYGIYLFHDIYLRLFARLLAGRVPSLVLGPTTDPWVWLPVGVALAATALTSFGLYHLVERPFIRAGARLASRWRAAPAYAPPEIPKLG
jgi:peptidoglycan/LPS O-acetylase OafA/YrhL